MEWEAIASSPRETNGFEFIPVAQVKAQIPAQFKAEKSLMVFRFGGGTGPRAGRIAGVRAKDRFSILFVDRQYKLYEH
jgi:hypothetical protein